ncbi:hypothetical protein ACSQ67_023002 [Phaseolus vulgaris]
MQQITTCKGQAVIYRELVLVSCLLLYRLQEILQLCAISPRWLPSLQLCAINFACLLMLEKVLVILPSINKQGKVSSQLCALSIGAADLCQCLKQHRGGTFLLHNCQV